MPILCVIPAREKLPVGPKHDVQPWKEKADQSDWPQSANGEGSEEQKAGIKITLIKGAWNVAKQRECRVRMEKRGDDIWTKGDKRLRSEGTKSTGIGYNPDHGPICCVCLIRLSWDENHKGPKIRVCRVPSYPVPCNGSLICMGCLTLGAHIPPQGS